MAAWIVQRPSPESETRPAKCSSFGSRARALAVKSRSCEEMMLPWRQTSAIAAISNVYWKSSGFCSGAVSASALRVARPAFACLRMFQSLGVGGHQPVLDAVVAPSSRSGPHHRPAMLVARAAVPADAFAAVPPPGASVANRLPGAQRRPSPADHEQKPRSSPSTPPLVPTST